MTSSFQTLLDMLADPGWVSSAGEEERPVRDPEDVFRYLGYEPDPWQRQLLRSPSKRLLVCCSRQSGKSQTAAAMALNTALLEAPALVLIISKALRQSSELLRKVKEMYAALRGEVVRKRNWRPIRVKQQQTREAQDNEEKVQDSVLSMEFGNGSRILSLPGTSDTIVGFTPDLIIIDEASRTSDVLYSSLRPMLAVSQGRMVVLSTPFGKRGWFWESWKRCEELKAQGLQPTWEQVKITVDGCPRISKEFLEEERLEIGDRWFRQEYQCSFEDVVDAVFAYADVHAMVSNDIAPLWE